MYGREEVTLSRDCEAIEIPAGSVVTLPAGSRVMIAQELGGSYTVFTDYGTMVRIDGKNADAIGKEVEPPPSSDEGGSVEDRVWAQMKKCYDPEIPANIVDLGLIYDCEIIDGEAEDKKVAKVKMTLTAPGCGMGNILAHDVQSRIEQLPEIEHAEVEVVFDPPWNMNMMTEEAKLQLGFM